MARYKNFLKKRNIKKKLCKPYLEAKDLVAFWNPDHKRFIDMGAKGMSRSKINSKGAVPKNWLLGRFQIHYVYRKGIFGDPCPGQNKHVIVDYVCKANSVKMRVLKQKPTRTTAIATLPSGATAELVASKDWTFETWVKLDAGWKTKTGELGRGASPRARFNQEGNLLRIDLHAELRTLRLEQLRLKAEISDYRKKKKRLRLKKN